MNTRTHQLRNQANLLSGYTLIELILTVVVLGIVGLTSSYVIVESMDVYARTAPALDASYQARLAIERLQRDIRNLEDPSAIANFTSTRLTFDSVAGVTLDLAASGGNLTRNGDLLARGVTAFEFRYFQRDGAIAPAPADLHLVEIDLTVQVADQEQRLLAVVYPRSLGP